MTATAADALRMLAPSTPDTWPAGILAAADIREMRAEHADGGPWMKWLDETEAEHIAAEANPAHALAAVRHWRSVAERHVYGPVWSKGCQECRQVWPCDDLTEVADEVRAYLGGSS